MLTEFKSHLQNNFPFLENSKFLLAISGGIDSVVLAHLLRELNLDFSLCHCNFKLRGDESEADEVFVKNLANRLDLNIFTTSFDTESYVKENKQSIQIAARNLRYQWFYELIKTHKFNYILTAHNANDNLETFIINLTRGTGLEGLTGIPPINKKSIRPLLKFTRDQIKMYAIKNGVEWREDKSNANVKYIRNKVRQQILPILQEINPNMIEGFGNTLEYLKVSQQILKEKVNEVAEKISVVENGIIKLDIKKLKKLENIKGYLYEILSPYHFTEWNDVYHLIDAQPGKQLFSKTHRLLKDRNYLLLTSIDENNSFKNPVRILQNQTEITSPIHIKFSEVQKEALTDKHSIIVDKDLLKYPLYIRKWNYGDAIHPTGMRGSKKVSQLFKDRKLSLIEKEKIWILSNANDDIIWVMGMRQDRRFKSTSDTEKSLKISLIN